jgi:hypothetical protein
VSLELIKVKIELLHMFMFWFIIAITLNVKTKSYFVLFIISNTLIEANLCPNLLPDYVFTKNTNDLKGL